jgi:hypothetical protein
MHPATTQDTGDPWNKRSGRLRTPRRAPRIADRVMPGTDSRRPHAAGARYTCDDAELGAMLALKRKPRQAKQVHPVDMRHGLRSSVLAIGLRMGPTAAVMKRTVPL